jgi:hypothetical protein
MHNFFIETWMVNHLQMLLVAWSCIMSQTHQLHAGRSGTVTGDGGRHVVNFLGDAQHAPGHMLHQP